MADGPRESRDFWNALGDRRGQAAAVDPNDRRGLKNAYISLVRDVAILEALRSVPETATVLDFGTGTGTFLSALRVAMPRSLAIGTDVSGVMLRHAVRRDPALSDALFLYDGSRLPISDCSIDAVTTGGVLLYFRGDQDFEAICREFQRVLRPGGRVIAVEQVRRRTLHDAGNAKVQRSPEEFIRLFESGGLRLETWRQVRRARFPLVYAIRYGLVPSAMHAAVARLESMLWADSAPPKWDYADASFSFVKPT